MGRRFERLTVTEYGGKSGHNHAWLCRCDCGGVSRVLAGNLLRGNTRSCGCLHSEVTAAHRTRHGHTKNGPSGEYTAHRAMLSRCYDPTNISFRYYGPKGIAVCDRWRFGEGGKSGFECFLADMGPKPSPKMSLERNDSAGPYAPSNCRWATAREQSANTSRNRWVEWRGKRMIFADAVRESGIRRTTIQQRVKRGMTMEAALTNAVRSHR